MPKFTSACEFEKRTRNPERVRIGDEINDRKE
jgi:hypothetical protein